MLNSSRSLMMLLDGHCHGKLNLQLLSEYGQCGKTGVEILGIGLLLN
jgi:hypothetical protein